ncbi:MAG: hypothetical protein LBQ96_07635 [Fusobacteriaceae bacterium]|jgi:hypothetical protein|nr:hypothetical protein [Fusobacteriaceae bacterium]
MRKALLLFGHEVEREKIVDSALFLQNQCDFEIIPLYIKDISRDRVLSAPGDSMILGSRSPVMFQGWAEIEKTEVDHIKRLLRDKGIRSELIVDIGLIVDIITEKMKSCDLLLMGKNEVFSEKTISILKGNYKCIIFIGDNPLKKLDNVLIANDDGVKINRSCYHFTTLFPEINKFASASINKKLEENVLKQYLEGKGKTVVHEDMETDNYDSILKRFDLFDLLIMGNLSRSYFFEKIIGKNGIKLIEKCKAPIFIG